MKKIILFMFLTLSLLVSCKPEIRDGGKSQNNDNRGQIKLNDKSFVIDNYKDVSFKNYELKLKDFNLENIEKTLGINAEIKEELSPELGKSYLFENGDTVSFYQGSLDYFASRSKYQSFVF